MLGNGFGEVRNLSLIFDYSCLSGSNSEHFERCRRLCSRRCLRKSRLTLLWGPCGRRTRVQKTVFQSCEGSAAVENKLIWSALIMSMLERPILKRPIQCTSQCVKRPSGAWILLRFARLFARSLARSIAQSIARSIAPSLERSVARSVARLVDRSIALSMGRSIDRSVALLLDPSLDHLPSSTTILADELFRGSSFESRITGAHQIAFASVRITNYLLWGLRARIVNVSGRDVI